MRSAPVVPPHTRDRFNSPIMTKRGPRRIILLVGMTLYIYIYVYTHIYIYIYRVCICICIYIYRVCICICIYIYRVYIYICMLACTLQRIYIRTQRTTAQCVYTRLLKVFGPISYRYVVNYDDDARTRRNGFLLLLLLLLFFCYLQTKYHSDFFSHSKSTFKRRRVSVYDGVFF